MGYSYDMQNRLYCDICGRTGGVRRRKCPYGWCQPTAMCPTCWKEKRHLMSKAEHQECKDHSEEYRANKAREAELLNSGSRLRVAAQGEDAKPGYVRVWFRGADGSEDQRLMARATYRALPVSAPATIADFARIGTVLPVPAQS